jgi:hypothetical protein
MRGASTIAMALILSSCWAPEILETRDTPVEDPGIPSPSDPEAMGPDGTRAPQVTLESTSPVDFPPPPFTAWTVASPLSIQGPSSESQPITLKRKGIRIEVLQVLGAPHNRMRIRCEDCTEDGQAFEGWLQTDKGIRVKGSHGSSTDPLASILRHRASWASEKGLPEGVQRNDICALVDHGFSLQSNAAIWAHEGGRIELRFEEGEWQLHELLAPRAGLSGSCRTTH